MELIWTQVGFPVPEGTSSNVLVIGLQLFGLLMLLVMSALEMLAGDGSGSSDGDANANIDIDRTTAFVNSWVATSPVCLMAFVLLLFKGIYTYLLLYEK